MVQCHNQLMRTLFEGRPVRLGSFEELEYGRETIKFFKTFKNKCVLFFLILIVNIWIVCVFRGGGGGPAPPPLVTILILINNFKVYLGRKLACVGQLGMPRTCRKKSSKLKNSIGEYNRLF